MKMGSLFDGIGGFPLSGSMCGVEPVWASEIEPFPILTTYKRFPKMKHLGSVTEINGAEIEPVDIITFGSPCQDLSVAGKQAGIHEGERSNLFFEAVRIIKEMRESDRAKGTPEDLCRPRFAVWENVPGAFSSNKGADFQAVLQALAEVADPDVSVPQSEKWAKAGCIVGEGWSIAWRVYDAQFWGVPQRRKRIYLIADFGSKRAGEILFEREGVHGNPAQSRTPWQRITTDAEGSVGRGCAAGFIGRQGAESGSVCYELEMAPTLRSTITSDTVISLQANGVNLAGGFCTEPSADSRNYLVYDARGNGDGDITPTLTGIAVHGFDMQAFGKYSDCGTSSTLKQRDYKDATDLVVEHGRRYIVRRLTPLECCRLQGYPDGWTENLAITEPTLEDVNFFTKVWSDWAAINGTKLKRENQVRKWLAHPQSDSAEYKAYGNSLAIPCAYDVIRRVVDFCGREDQTDY